MTDAMFARLLESAPDAMIIVDGGGKIAMVNGQTEKMFGYERAGLIGKSVEMLMPKAARTRHRKHLAAYFDDPRTRPMGQELALTGRARDGREFSIEISLGSIETETGVLSVAAVRDVSEQRKAERELRVSEQRRATAQRIAGLGNWDRDIVNDQSYWSEEFCRIMGVSPETFESSYQSFLDRVHPDDLDFVIRKDEEAKKHGSRYLMDYRIIRPDGEVRYIHSTAEVTLNEAGEPVRMSGVDQDITNRKRAEAEILAAKDKAAAAGNQLKSAIESIAEGFVLFDSKGRLVLCNSAFRGFHGYSEADTEPGVATYESLNRLDKERNIHAYKRRTFRRSLSDLRRAGSMLFTETMGGRVIERRQEMTAEGGIISVQTDITERMRAEESLQERIKFSGLLQRITIAANQAASVEGVLQFCLDEVCAATGWPVGHVYFVVDDGSGDVVSSNLWRLDMPNQAAWVKRIADLRPFTPGQGLIGRVLASGMPAWIVDVTQDQTFERAKLAEDLGVKAGFSFPVLTGKKTAAIIEFFSREAVEPDRHLLEVMAQIGTQLGRVIERRAAEDALRERIEAAGLLQTITDAANEASTVEDALQVCLDAVCAFTGWPVGHVFLQVEGKPDQLESTGLWHLDNPRKFAAFKRVTRDMQFSMGKGLISRILTSGKPAWIADVSKNPLFERAQGDRDIGVKAAFAFPVMTGKNIAAVFEFFSGEAIEPDEHILDVMAQIGTQLGRVIERRAAQEALRESEERFRFVMDHSPAAVNLKDKEGRYLLVNARFEEWYGLAARDVIGKTVDEVFPFLKMAPFAALERQMLRSKTPSEREFEIDFADGKKHLVLGSKFIVEDRNGDAMGVGTIETDITETRQTETQLRQAQKMEAVGQLTGGIAHDFNNLLAVISGNLELLDEALEGDEKKRELLGWAVNAADDAAVLTRHLLSFSRRQPLSPRTVLINDLVSNLLTMLRRSLGETIDIEIDLCGDLWLTTVDPAQFESAVLNLVLNARDAMPDGGVITITTVNVTLAKSARRDPDTVPGDYVKLSVGDTGHGLSDEALEHAFEPFYTTKEIGRGSGLGLSMVYGFSKQSGGHADLENVKGQGAVVSLYLPRATNARVAVIAAEDAAVPQGKGEAVLVVEDEEHVRKLAVRLIHDLGYHVLEAADAKSALLILDREKHVDLLFTDVVLPGGVSGRDLVAQAIPKRPALAVIYVSGYSAAIEAETPIEESAVRLAKPYRRKVLAIALRKALGDGV